LQIGTSSIGRVSGAQDASRLPFDDLDETS
jgi:hypothetical protein